MDGLTPGSVLADRYLLVEPLRRGGGAIVWRGLDRDRDRAVALKFMTGDDPAHRLEREFARLQRIDHPGVVRALAVENEPPMLVLELVEGPELRTMMGADHRTWIPPLRGALDGLAAAHAAGVVHGDISAHNVVIDDTGRGRLVDFGDDNGRDPVEDLRALGALMHMLISGSPPDGGSYAALDARPVPPSLRQLVVDLLETPEQQSLPGVRSRLDALLQGTPAERFERITPAERTSAPRQRVPAAVEPTERRWKPFAVLGFIALMIVAGFVTWSRIGSDRVVPATSDPVQEAGSRLELQREGVRQLRESTVARWRKLESMDVFRWAQLRAENAEAALQRAEHHEQELNTLSAMRELRAADELITALLAEAPQIARFHRDAGLQAMQRGDAEGAATHFRAVLAIEPADESVRKALARTRHLDDVTELRRQAQQSEAQGDLDSALSTLRKAADIDNGNEQLAEQIARLTQEIDQKKFTGHMSRAYRDLSAKRYDGARKAIAAAARLRPDAPEVRDARTQLQVAERAAAIGSLRDRAEQAEAAEDWERAIGLYGELLQLDGALVFARERRDRARLLASLTAQAQALLDDPEFERDQAMRQARTVIEQIGSVQAQAHALRALATRLEQRLALAQEPVPVRLQSDNQTEVTIFRVGRLGRFANHEVELLPGRYTVVGVRDGYRDVRRELIVPTGQPVASFVIQCEERI